MKFLSKIKKHYEVTAADKLRVAFFHIADLDGHCSGAIFKRVAKLKGWSNVKLMPYNYGYDIDIAALKGADVYFLDCTPSPIAQLAPKLADVADVYVCDHHKTAIEDPAFKKHLSRGNSRVGNDSGCALTWEYFKDVLGDMPRIVRLLSTYDVWNDKDKKQWENEIMPVQYGMKSFQTDPTKDAAVWDRVFDDKGEFLSTLMEVGNTIYRYEQERLALVSKNAFEVKFDGKDAVCLNTCTKSSQAFKAAFDPEKHDLMIAFTLGLEGGTPQYNVSLYSTDPAVNCGEICKRYGGGGHVGAAGLRSKKMTILDGVLKFGE